MRTFWKSLMRSRLGFHFWLLKISKFKSRENVNILKVSALWCAPGSPLISFTFTLSLFSFFSYLEIWDMENLKIWKLLDSWCAPGDPLLTFALKLGRVQLIFIVHYAHTHILPRNPIFVLHFLTESRRFHVFCRLIRFLGLRTASLRC